MHRQFVATAYVVHDGRILLLKHKKLGKWLPPGGHIDADELPQDAAVRECKEETGLDIDIVDTSEFDAYAGTGYTDRTLKRPFAMFLEHIPAFAGAPGKEPQPEHEHMDFVFIAKLTDPTQAHAVHEDEADEIRWFTRGEIEAMGHDDIFLNVRGTALRLLA